MTKIVGITGGIASGKSTVVAQLRKHGYQVIDADQVVHDLQKKSGRLYPALFDWHSDAILQDHGELDHQPLGQEIFRNKKQMDK